MSKHWKNNYISKFSVASKFSRIPKTYQLMYFLSEEHIFWIYLWILVISQIDDDTLQNFLLNSLSYYRNNIGGKVQSVCMLLKFQKCFIFSRLLELANGKKKSSNTFKNSTNILKHSHRSYIYQYILFYFRKKCKPKTPELASKLYLACFPNTNFWSRKLIFNQKHFMHIIFFKYITFWKSLLLLFVSGQ